LFDHPFYMSVGEKGRDEQEWTIQWHRQHWAQDTEQ